MLAADRSGPASTTPDWHEDTYPSHVLDQAVEIQNRQDQLDRERDLATAAYDWHVALEQSRMAPPDARFAMRIRQVAEAAGSQAGAILDAIGDPGFEWKPTTEADGTVAPVLQALT